MTNKTSNANMDNFNEPISIVGAGCRLPGNVSTIDDLLAVFQSGKDCITNIPSERWGADEFYDPDPMAEGKTYVREGGFMSDIDQFDAGFFGISDHEAVRMDPQQRILLQTVWHALEHAGQSSEDLYQSNTGVFLAMMNTNDYSQLKGWYGGLKGVNGYDSMGDAMSITAGRVSHALGVEGPCMAIDTACSGSMVALHQARSAILAGDCDSAIVAGVSVILHPGVHIAFSKIGLMSRSGRCRTFDSMADGYVRSEGCVAVVLRRQSLALSRGDNILANIIGTAVNHDGRTPALTAPSGQSQERVMRMALAKYGVNPHQISYLEAHGTGTPVGDPIEMGALSNVFGVGRSEDNPLYVGSAKSNFGHIEAGAGLLGLLKASLSLNTREIFPSIHFSELNPNINLDNTEIKIASTRESWVNDEQLRMAGVNSFGYSGTNAHAILQEAPPIKTDELIDNKRNSELLVISAKSVESLKNSVNNWIDFLEHDESSLLSNIAFVAATGRAHFQNRIALVGETKQEMADKLRKWQSGKTVAKLVSAQTSISRKRKIAFVFTGQGSQYTKMGQELYHFEPKFKEAIDRCADVMKDSLNVPLLDILFGSDSSEYLNHTQYVQPAIFSIQYALVEVFSSLGITPNIVIGHSVGEIAAACVAGILTLEDGAKFAVERGRLMGELKTVGKMVALHGDLEQIQQWVDDQADKVSIAAINGPKSIVISGDMAEVDKISAQAKAVGFQSKDLSVAQAFHSPLMEPILEKLQAAGNCLRYMPEKIPFVSNLTGDLIEGKLCGDYWGEHARQAVQFHKGIDTVMKQKCSLIVEIGPHANLLPMILSSIEANKAQCISTLNRDKCDVKNILNAIGSMHVQGVPLNLERLFWSSAYRRVFVPLYSFKKKKYWLEKPVPKNEVIELKEKLHPFLHKVIEISKERALFETTLTASPPWSDHQVFNSTVFPATGYIDLIVRGFNTVKNQKWNANNLRDIVFEKPLLLGYRQSKNITLIFEDIPAGKGYANFSVVSSDDRKEVYCRGKVGLGRNRIEEIPLNELLQENTNQLNVGNYYAELRRSGLEYGANFAIVRELWLGNDGSQEALGKIAFHGIEGKDNPYLNSQLLDGALHVFAAALKTMNINNSDGAYIPVSVRTMLILKELPNEIWSHVKVRVNEKTKAVIGEICILSPSGEVLAEFDDIELRQKSSFNSGASMKTIEASSTTESLSKSKKELMHELNSQPEKAGKVEVLSQWLILLIKNIVGEAYEEMDFDSLEPNKAFIEIGLDSLLITELQRRIQETLDIRFEPMDGLDYQSVEFLAEYILDNFLSSNKKAIKELAENVE